MDVFRTVSKENSERLYSTAHPPKTNSKLFTKKSETGVYLDLKIGSLFTCAIIYFIFLLRQFQLCLPLHPVWVGERTIEGEREESGCG